MPLKHRRRLFPVSVSQWAGDAGKRENEWLDNAWATIKQKFFVNPTDKLGKAKLGLRAITMAMIYSDFCYLAWDLDYDIYECIEWAEELGIDKKILIKLAKEEGQKIALNDFTRNNSEFVETLAKITDGLREEVFDMLCPNDDKYEEIFKGLVAINDPSEYNIIMSKVHAWFEEKWCRQQ